MAESNRLQTQGTWLRFWARYIYPVKIHYSPLCTSNNMNKQDDSTQSESRYFLCWNLLNGLITFIGLQSLKDNYSKLDKRLASSKKVKAEIEALEKEITTAPGEFVNVLYGCLPVTYNGDKI